MMEHQASRRINLSAEAEKHVAEVYSYMMVGDHYVHHVPNSIMRGIENYVAHYPVGSFLEAVITNDLQRAITAADPYSLYALPAIVKYIDKIVPSKARGSQEKYDRWISNK